MTWHLTNCLYENITARRISFIRVVMLITLAVVLTLALLTEFTIGDYNYADSTDNMADEESAQDEWIDEALLDVAFYLRMHKFNEFDRR